MKKHSEHFVVVGLGVSGLSAVHYLYDSVRVSVTDENPAPTLAKELPAGVDTAFGEIDGKLLLTADTIVISPGVNPAISAIIEAKNKGIPIISDVQLFVEACHEKGIQIVAITGSNAKSTVTTLVGEMAQQASVLVGVGGNLGVPALRLLEQPIEYAVLELSSFQLEGITNLSAKVAAFLNLSSDHLDRHGDMAGYLAAKMRIFQNAQSAVLYADDEALYHACQDALPQTPMFAITAHPPKNGEFGLVKQDDKLYLAQDDTLLLSSDELFIKGTHNLTNALFALAIGTKMGLPMESMIKTLKGFKGLAHRCQYVAQVGGTAYFNDSKGTNVGATISAIEGLGAVYGKQSLVVILGGQGKGQCFSTLATHINAYGHTVLTIGEDAQKISDDLMVADLNVPLINVGTLETAVKTAHSLNAPVVLLSPACASFDQFTGFVQRGEYFVALIECI